MRKRLLWLVAILVITGLALIVFLDRGVPGTLTGGTGLDPDGPGYKLPPDAPQGQDRRK